MDIADLLHDLRDPLAAPFYPQVFRALLVITWVLHIFFVTLALGSSTFTVFGYVRPNERRLRLARTTARLTPNAVGLGIVTGIAPLLFVQTIYDPIWYASNTLTGLWSVLFVFVVMGGYGSAYLFSLKGSEHGRHLWSAVASVLLLFFAGWIMHVLASVQLEPDQWMKWYAPKGIVDTRGTAFHAFNLPRLAFLLPLQAMLSIAVVLPLYAWYAGRRDGEAERETDSGYLPWVAGLGRRLGLVAGPLYALAGLAWGLTQGDDYGVRSQVAGVTIGLGLLITGWFAVVRDPQRRARASLGVWFATLAVVAVLREYVRTEALARFDYSVADYPYRINWGSVILFTVTTVVGTSILVYLALVLYQSGARNGRIGRRVDRFGKFATAMLGAWFAFFLGLGLFAVLVLNN